MKHIIQCFCIFVLSAFVASLPQPNEHHVHKTAVNNEGETPQQDLKIHKAPETEHKHVSEDGVYKNQNSYPRHYNHRGPVHQYHPGVHGYNSRWPPAYVGYDPHAVHRPLNPVLIPEPYQRDGKPYQDSGEVPVLYSGHLEREPREEPVPLVYPDYHHPHVHSQISEHPYHGHHPLPLYHPQVHEYPPYPVHNGHGPQQSVLPIYLFSAPGGSQIRNYFQRILHKVPQRMNIKKKPKIIIEYLNGTVEYVDIPDLIEYAPGVVLNENGDKIVKGKDVLENIPPREEITVAEPSYVFEPKYVPPSHKNPIVISETHIRENPIKARQEDGVLEEYIDDSVKPVIEVDSSGTSKVALVVEEIVPKEVIISEDSPVVEPADDSYYYINQKQYIGRRPAYRYRPIEVIQKNINPEEPINESYNDKSYPGSREVPTVSDITQDDYLNSENEPVEDLYAIPQKHYVSRRPSRAQYRRIPANVRPENDKPEKSTGEPYYQENYPDSEKDSSVPSRDTIIVGDDTPQDVPTARNPYLNPEYEYYIKQRQLVGQKPYNRGQYISRPIRYHRIPPNVKRDDNNPGEAKDGTNHNENDSGSPKDYDEPLRETSIVRDSQQDNYPNSENEPALDNGEFVESQNEDQQNPTNVKLQHNNPETLLNEPKNNDNNPDFDVVSSESIRATPTDNEQNDYPNGQKPVEGSYHNIKYSRYGKRRLSSNENEPVDNYFNNDIPSDSGEDVKETTSIIKDDKQDEPTSNEHIENASDVEPYESPEQKPLEESQVTVPQNKHKRNPDNVEPKKYNSESPTNESPSDDNSSVSDKDTARHSNPEKKPLKGSQVTIPQKPHNRNPDTVEPKQYNSENTIKNFPSDDDSSVSDKDTARHSNPEQKPLEGSQVTIPQKPHNHYHGNIESKKYNSESPTNESPSDDNSSVSDKDTVRHSNPEREPLEGSQITIPQKPHNRNPDTAEPKQYNSENTIKNFPSDDDSSVSDIDTSRPSNAEQQPLEESQVIISQNTAIRNLDNVEPEKYNSENTANDSPGNDDSSASDTDTAGPSTVFTKDTPTTPEDHPYSEKAYEDNDISSDNDQISTTQIKYYNTPTYVKPEDGDIDTLNVDSYKANDNSESRTDSSEPSTGYTNQVTTTTEDHPTIGSTENVSDYNKKQKPSDNIPKTVKHRDETIKNTEIHSDNDHHTDSDIDSSETSTVTSTASTKQETTTTRSHHTKTENDSEYSYYNVKQKQGGKKPKTGDISKVKPTKEDTVKPIDDSSNENNLQSSKLDSTESIIVTSTIEQDDNTSIDEQNDSDSTKQKESKGSKALSEKPVEGGLVHKDSPTSGLDKETTIVTTTVIHNEQDDEYPYIVNDVATDRKTKPSNEDQVTEDDSRNPSLDQSEIDNTEISIKNQHPSDSDINEYHHISSNNKPEHDGKQKSTDDSNKNSTKKLAIVKQTIEDANNDVQPNPENDSEPTDIVKQKHDNDNAENWAGDFNKKDDNSILKPSGIDAKQTTKVANAVEKSTPTKDDQPKPDKIDSIKDNIPQNHDNVGNAKEKHVATVTETSNPTIKPDSSTPRFGEPSKQSDVDGSTDILEEYPETGPNDFDKKSSRVKGDIEVESSVNEPPLTTGTDDDKGYESTPTENSIKSEKTDYDVDSKEEKTPMTQSSTVYNENNDGNNPGVIHEQYKKVKPTSIETTKRDKGKIPNHSKVDDIDSTTSITTPPTKSNNDSDDDQESVEDQYDSETIPNYSSNESGNYNSDNKSFNDSAEEVDDEPIEEDKNEIDEANEYVGENDQGQNEVEGNDQSSNEIENHGQGKKKERENNQDLNEEESNEQGQNNTDENNSKKSKTTQVSSSVDNTDITTSTSTKNKNTRESTTKGSQTTIYHKRNDENDAIGKENHGQVDEDDKNSTNEIILDSKEIACNIEENKNKIGCRNQEIEPLVSFHPDTDYYKKLIEEYNRLHFFRMNSSASLIHRDTKSLVYENGTVVDYLSETYWEKENDDKPIKVRTSQVIRQPLNKDEKDC